MASDAGNESEKVPTDEAGYRQFMLKKIMALQAEHGEAHIQKLLQAEIQAVKKKTAEVLAVDKQLRQQRRNTDKVRAQLLSVQDLQKKAEAVSQTLQYTIKKRSELTKRMVEEMKENREQAIQQTREKVQSFKDSTTERKKLLEESQRENEELKRESEELQESFKKEYEKFQEDLRVMFTPTSELKELQEEADKVNALQDVLRKKEAQHSSCVTGAKMLEQQLVWYAEQFSEFEAVIVDPESVKVIIEKQRVAGEERINEAKKEAEVVKAKRAELEAEIKELRVKFAALNKKLVQVESSKKAAEKKCRQAQEKAKKQHA